MKFAFLMVTRGNPSRAGAVIECAKSLSSGKHEIEYVIGCDRDDDKTHSWFWQNYPEMGDNVSIGERPVGLGSVWNRLCKLVPDADYYCPFPDDVFISLPDWDNYVAQTMGLIENPGLRVLAWNDIRNSGQCTLPIVSREWLNLVGKLYDDRFPFWFYDTCVDELYTFVSGNRIPIPHPLSFASQKGLTQNLRELPFWWDFYVATRQERLAQAASIRKQLGITIEPAVIDVWRRSWEKRDKIGRDTAADLERALSAEGRKPPSEQYLKARNMAAAYLNTNKAITPARAGLASSEAAA